MRHKVIFLIILVLNKSQLNAQPVFNQKYGSERDYKKLWYLNIQYIQSWIRSDTATYNKLLWAEDFVHQSAANGYLYPKKEIMPIFGQVRFAGIQYFYADSTRIQFITDDVAMILSKPPYLANGDAQESTTRYNDVYVKRNGNWICVSANITAVTGPGAPLPFLTSIPSPTKFISYMQATEKDITELTTLHRATKDVFDNHDFPKAEELLDDGFTLLAEDGSLRTKQQLISWLKMKSKRRQHSYKIENLFIRFVATTVAMVHGAVIYESNTGITGIQFNDIYVKRGNTWKYISSNNTPIKN
jgi:hypothetical protein